MEHPCIIHPAAAIDMPEFIPVNEKIQFSENRIYNILPFFFNEIIEFIYPICLRESESKVSSFSKVSKLFACILSEMNPFLSNGKRLNFSSFQIIFFYWH